jgi:hypothetical protein
MSSMRRAFGSVRLKSVQVDEVTVSVYAVSEGPGLPITGYDIYTEDSAGEARLLTPTSLTEPPTLGELVAMVAAKEATPAA